MKKFAWISREECVAIHETTLARHGGPAGVRDGGLLESALSKPSHLVACAKPTLAELAASYAAALIRNHPFLDGNKRTGFLVAAVFLEANGCQFIATEESVVENTLGLAAGKLKEKDSATWLKENLRRRL